MTNGIKLVNNSTLRFKRNPDQTGETFQVHCSRCCRMYIHCFLTAMRSVLTQRGTGKRTQGVCSMNSKAQPAVIHKFNTVSHKLLNDIQVIPQTPRDGAKIQNLCKKTPIFHYIFYNFRLYQQQTCTKCNETFQLSYI